MMILKRKTTNRARHWRRAIAPRHDRCGQPASAYAWRFQRCGVSDAAAVRCIRRHNLRVWVSDDTTWREECYTCGLPHTRCETRRQPEIGPGVPDPHEFETFEEAERNKAAKQLRDVAAWPPRKAALASDALTSAIFNAAGRGLQPHCTDAATSELWLNEHPAARAEAARLCTGCGKSMLVVEPGQTTHPHCKQN
jgi:hypothetical protein